MSNSKANDHERGHDHRDLEIVLGLVAPVGTKLNLVVDALETKLGHARYDVKIVHVAKDVIPEFVPAVQHHEDPFELAMEKMTAGNEARKICGDNAILALGAATNVYATRPRDEHGNPKSLGRTAHIIRSLKHPEEVERLREIYPGGFYLIGVTADERRRKRFLEQEREMTPEDAQKLMERDADEELSHGQRVTDTFHMADFFVQLDESCDRLNNSLGRIIELLLGYPYHTPTFDEYAMFLAFAASLRSADLSRQVGAVVADDTHREILATGANDCPKAGGGLYWPVEGDDGVIKDEPRGRDHTRGQDQNAVERQALVEELAALLKDGNKKADVVDAIRRSSLRNITEYGRVVHAEMEALLSCARNQFSTRGKTLYTTTFPCHNCAKHIIAAGLRRVVYVEPYTKSKAADFHDDALHLADGAEFEKRGEKKVSFEAFVGVGPRRFFDLFSTRLGTGRELRRKGGSGKTLAWTAKDGIMRRAMLPYSYLDLEAAAAEQASQFQRNKEDDGGTSAEAQ